jgi:hypothetical protein
MLSSGWAGLQVNFRLWRYFRSACGYPATDAAGEECAPALTSRPLDRCAAKLATLRAHSINRSASGVSVRSLTVMTPTGAGGEGVEACLHYRVCGRQRRVGGVADQGSPRPITIYFRHVTEFGDRVTFMPKRRIAIRFWRVDPVVAKLKQLAGLLPDG